MCLPLLGERRILVVMVNLMIHIVLRLMLKTMSTLQIAEITGSRNLIVLALFLGNGARMDLTMEK